MAALNWKNIVIDFLSNKLKGVWDFTRIIIPNPPKTWLAWLLNVERCLYPNQNATLCHALIIIIVSAKLPKKISNSKQFERANANLDWKQIQRQTHRAKYDANAASRLIVSINREFMWYLSLSNSNKFKLCQTGKGKYKTLNRNGNMTKKVIFEYTHVYCFGM